MSVVKTEVSFFQIQKSYASSRDEERGVKEGSKRQKRTLCREIRTDAAGKTLSTSDRK